MTDWTRYVGLPWRAHGRDRDGVDCWGLVRLVYAAELGIDLPCYADTCPGLDERAELSALLLAQRDAGPWHEVDDIQPFDVLLFRVGAHATHVAVALDRRRMLHAFARSRSVVQDIDLPEWRKRRVGVYRYTARPAVHVVEARGLLPDRNRRCFDLAPTVTIAEIVAQLMPGASDEALDRVRVTMSRGTDWTLVPRRWWPHVRPHGGTSVAVRLVPGDPFGFAINIAMFLSANTALGAAAINVLAYGAATAVTALGAAAITSLIPIPEIPDGPRSPETRYDIRGWRNTAIPGEPVPSPYGTIRVAPVYAMQPYQEIVGDDQFVRALFCFGYGRLAISDLRIGDTPIDEFADVDYELREGAPDDEPVTITPIQVLEQPEQIELTYPWPKDAEGNDITSGDREEQPVIRTTASNSVRVGLVFAFPGGLFWFKDDTKRNQDMTLRIRQRQQGTETWSTVTTLTYVERKLNSFFRQYTWDLPSRGTWEIEVTRLTPMFEENPQRSARCYLNAVQSYRPEYPIAMATPLALCGIKMRASYQLNGTLDSLNAVVSRYARDWDGADWVEGETRNPASLYVLALQGPDNPFPVADDEIDWDTMADWHDLCVDKGLHYDRDQRSSESLGSRLKAIAAAGRAAPWHTGSKWSVIVDRPSDVQRDVICPANSEGFSGSRSYIDTPDAVRVRFRDRTNGYEEAEVLIPWPGKSAPYDLVEQWEAPAKTDPVEIQREIYRQMLSVEYRRDRWTVEQSEELRAVTRGDRVPLSHYVLSDVQWSGRVLSADGALITLDEAVTMEADTAYAIRFLDFDEADPVGESVLSSVMTVPGETRVLHVTGSAVPSEGAVCLFGPAGEESFAALVLNVEPGQDFWSTLTLTNAADEIDTLTDAYVPADWSPIVGEIVDVGLDPAAPVFAGIATRATEGAWGSAARTLAVSITSAPAERALIAGFELDHRLSGAGTWTTVSLTGGYVTAELSYDTGDTVELRARGEDFDGDFGPYTATETFVVGSDLGAVPATPDLAAITVTGGLGRAEITLAHSDPNTVAIQIFRTADGDAFDAATDVLGEPVTVPAGTPVAYVDGDATRADILAATWTAGGGWGSTALPATHTPGSTSTLSQAFAFEVRTYRGQITISGRTAGSVTVQLTGGSTVATSAISANGATLIELNAVSGNAAIEVVATSDFDGTVESVRLIRETAACAPQGGYNYRFAGLNVDEIGSAVSSEIAVTII